MLQPGRELLAAGLALFGVKTRLVLAGEGGASQYLLDKDIGEFMVDQPLVPPSLLGAGDQLILSTGTPDCIEDPFDTLVERLKVENTVRYCHTGLAAIDCYSVMVGGGLWIGNGGLGLLYHGVPLAFIAERGGGTVMPEVLEITPNHIHQKVQVAVMSALDATLTGERQVPGQNTR